MTSKKKSRNTKTNKKKSNKAGRSRASFLGLGLAIIIGLGVWFASGQSPAGVFEENTATSTQPTSTDQTASIPSMTLEPEPVTLPNGVETSFNLPADLTFEVAAENLGKARFMTMSPDGRVFVPDLVNYNLSHQGRLFVLDDFNEQTGQFETRNTYLSGLRGPNSLAFHTDDNGQTWLYLALTAHIIRYPYEAGDTAPSGEGQIVTQFPNKQVKGEESVVWHITRTIEFHDGRLYASVGSGCNACEQPEGQLRGMIYSMKPDGSDKQVYARHLRNSVGFTWANGELYATANGVDHLGPNAPDGMLYKLEEGEKYGWPYCYELNGEIREDNYRNWERSYSCSEVPLSFAAFEPRSAPLGVEYFENAPPSIENSFLVAIHGSFEPGVESGVPKIFRVSESGEKSVFMNGFETDSNERVARPVDFLSYDENSFFFTDDESGRIYYVHPEEE